VRFIKAQREKGATIVGICAGVLTLGAAGLVDGRRATTHWYVIDDLRRDHPTMQWARDRRYVADRGVVTTTGVTASIPVSIAIVEAIAGRERAEALARELGVTDWSARHDSDAFRLGAGGVATALGNTIAFWGHQTIGIPVAHGVDAIFTVACRHPMPLSDGCRLEGVRVIDTRDERAAETQSARRPARQHHRE